MKRHRHGFTLMELLTVIAIVALLMGLLLPVLSRARERARITQAKATCLQIETALKSYLEDYRSLDGVPEGPTGVGLLNVLLGGNPRDRRYIEATDAELDSGGLRDPWGNTYEWKKAEDGVVDTGNDTVYRDVAVWSYGPDGDEGTDDDVKSWE